VLGEELIIFVGLGAHLSQNSGLVAILDFYYTVLNRDSSMN